MNGAFIFSADLLRELDERFTIQFVHISSYLGMSQNSEIKLDSTIDWTAFQGKNVLIVEDIIESGNTLTELISQFYNLKLKSLKIVCLIIKPHCVKVNFKDLIVGFEIKDEFIVGYGMDYNGLGRGLKDIYQLDN